jgi:hypothetical protein
MTRLITAVELRGLEPLTSSMPWWPGKRRRRAGSVDRVQGRAGAVTPIQPGSPSVCPPSLKRPAIADLSPQCRAISSVGRDHTLVRVHAGSCGTWHTLTAHRRRPSPRWDVRSVRLLERLPTSALSGMPCRRAEGGRPRMNVRDCPWWYACSWVGCYSVCYSQVWPGRGLMRSSDS